MCCPKAFAPEPRKPRLQPTIQVTRCRHQLPTTSFLGSKGWCQVVQRNFEAPDRPTNRQERATNQPKQPPNNKGVASQRGFSKEKCHFDAPLPLFEELMKLNLPMLPRDKSCHLDLVSMPEPKRREVKVAAE